MSEPARLEGGFSRSLVGWIAGLGVASFALALVLTAFGEDLWGRPTPHANSFSRSALGHHALVELLQSMGLGVVSRRHPGTGEPGTLRPLIAAEPDPDVLASAPERLADLVREAKSRDAALIVVLPKWQGQQDPVNPGWIVGATLLPRDSVLQAVEALGVEPLKGVRLRRQEVAGTLGCSAGWRPQGGIDYRVDLVPVQLLEPGPGLEAEVTCGKGLLVARHRQAPDGPEIYLVADPDLMSNHGLPDGDNAPLVFDFLTHRLGARGAIFDETVHGFRRTPGLLAEAFRFPLLPAVLQTVVLTGILLWAGMGRFGKPLPPPAGLGNGRQVLIESTARLLTHGGHGAESLARYFQQTLRALAPGLGLSADTPEPELLSRLQRISRERRLGMDLTLLQSQVASPPAGELATDWALSIARDLHRWRQEMTEEMRDGHRKRS